MKVVKGDLLQMFRIHQFDVIIHGCNCFHTMGAGIARQIAEKWPVARSVDKLNSQYGDWEKLSNWTIANVFDGDKTKRIINLYTQYHPGPDLYENALFLGFEKLVSFHLGRNLRVGIPAIGAGLAGGNWDNIFPVLSEITKGHDFTYVQYEPAFELHEELDKLTIRPE